MRILSKLRNLFRPATAPVGTTKSGRKGRISYRIEIFQGKDGHYWRLVSAKNGEILSLSESYTTAAMRNKTALRLYNNMNNGVATELVTVNADV